MKVPHRTLFRSQTLGFQTAPSTAAKGTLKLYLEPFFRGSLLQRTLYNVAAFIFRVNGWSGEPAWSHGPFLWDGTAASRAVRSAVFTVWVSEEWTHVLNVKTSWMSAVFLVVCASPDPWMGPVLQHAPCAPPTSFRETSKSGIGSGPSTCVCPVTCWCV